MEILCRLVKPVVMKEAEIVLLSLSEQPMDGVAWELAFAQAPQSRINDFMASNNNDGVWTINSLPTGAMPVTDGTQMISVPDTDFLAGGIWVYVPDDATSVDDFTFGAFVHGEDPYDPEQSNRLNRPIYIYGRGNWSVFRIGRGT